MARLKAQQTEVERDVSLSFLISYSFPSNGALPDFSFSRNSGFSASTTLFCIDWRLRLWEHGHGAVLTCLEHLFRMSMVRASPWIGGYLERSGLLKRGGSLERIGRAVARLKAFEMYVDLLVYLSAVGLHYNEIPI